MAIYRLFLVGVFALPLWAEGAGVLDSVRAPADFALTADPNAAHWRGVEPAVAATDPWGKPMPGARTEIRSRWTDASLYFLFSANYEAMHLTPKPTPEKETWGIWDYDVVEVFIGHDFQDINRYKEIEVTPQGEFVDIAVQYVPGKGPQLNWLWDSGMQYKVRVDQERKMWFCEMRFPWSALDPRTPAAGHELRLNLYRIEGAPPHRKYIVWRPVHNPSYHTPAAFGRLRLTER
jgi:hypothetical protein